MPSPTVTFQMTDQEIYDLLGITTQDLVRLANPINDEEAYAFTRFWAQVFNRIAEATTWPPDATAQEIEELRAKQKFLLEWAGQVQADLGALREQRTYRSDIQEEISSIRSQYRQIEEQITQKQIVRIGTQIFGPENVQPHAITVEETHQIRPLMTMRSAGEASAKLPRSQTEITITLAFHGAQDINRRLRYLIAELYASPITTIESAFLVNALVNQFASPEIEQIIQERIYEEGEDAWAAEVDRLDAKARESYDDLKEILFSDDLVFEYLKTRAKKARELQDARVPEKTTESEVVDFGVAIPVVLAGCSISTESEAVNTVQVVLRFYRVNVAAFGAGVIYRDAAGNATPDITQCPWIKLYSEWAFMNDQANPAFFLSPYAPDEVIPDFQCEWDDINSTKGYLKRSFPTKSTRFQLVGVQAGWMPKIALVPVLGSKYPTVQIMGRSSVTANVQITTTDRQVVRDLTLMKDHLDAISRNVGGQFRNEKVQVTNGILNLLGAKDFLIAYTRIENMPETSNGYRIDMKLAEARYSDRETQALILHDRGVHPDGIRAVWDYIYENLNAWHQTETPTPLQTTVAKMVYGADVVGRSVRDDTVLNGMMSEDLVVAGLMRLYRDRSDVEGSWNSTRTALETYRWIFGGHGVEQGVPTFLPEGSYPGDWEDGRRLFERIFHFAEFPPGGNSASRSFRAKLEGQEDTSLEADLFDWPTSFGRRDFTWRKDLWDAMVDVILDPAFSPPGVANLLDIRAKEDDKSKIVQSSNALWHDGRITRAFRELSDLFVRGAVVDLPDFPWQQYYDPAGYRATTPGLNLSDRTAARLLSNYPDMPLPTYEEFFQFVEEQTKGAIPTQVFDASQDRSIPLWTRFAPTYSDLGRIPDIVGRTEVLQESLKIADGPDSGAQTPRSKMHMEPGFWFYVRRAIHQMIEKAERYVKQAGQSPENFLTPELRYTVEEGTDENDLYDKFQRDAKEYYARQVGKTDRVIDYNSGDASIVDLTKKAREEGRIIHLYSSRGARVGFIRPHRDLDVHNAIESLTILPAGQRVTAYANTALGSIVDLQANGPENDQRALLTRMLQGHVDNALSVARNYPCFRVYFIEWDDNLGRAKAQRGNSGFDRGIRRIRMMDDLYSSNAILNINVTLRKDDASVAVLEILNTVGTFDKDSFATTSEFREEYKDDTREEEFLSRFRLKTGTGIMIQMGYNSDVYGLTTIFTGQIAEIRPGEIIQLVAQGWKTELYQNVDFGTGREKTWNDRAALTTVLNDPARPCPHLGRFYDVRDLTAHDVLAIQGSESAAEDSLRQGPFNLFGSLGTWGRTFGASFSTIEKNIWFDKQADPSWLTRTGQRISQSLHDTLVFWDQQGVERPLVFYRTNMWDATQEVLRFNPGLIADVRPFDTEATLFVGRPDQAYLWRTPSGIEIKLWERKARPVRAVNTMAIYLIFLNQFFTSDYGTTNAAQEFIDLTRAGVFGDKSVEGLALNTGGGGRYRNGSRLSQEGNPGTRVGGDIFSDISQSYTGFIKWAAQQLRHVEVAGERDFYGGWGSGEVNPWSQIPMVESEQYDLTNEWDAIGSFNPELQKFLFAWFFKLNYDDPAAFLQRNNGTRSVLQSVWTDLARTGMGSLRKTNNELTDQGERFYSELLGPERNGKNTLLEGILYSEQADPDFWNDPATAAARIIAEVRRLGDLGQLSREEAQVLIDQLNVLRQELLDSGTVAGPEGAALGITLDEIVGQIEGLRDTWANNLRVGHFQGTNLGHVLWEYWRPFRIFVHYFYQWLTKEYPNRIIDPLPDVDTQGAFDQIQVTDMPAWFRPFRNYHSVFSRHDIIDNKIIATESQMANCVQVFGPDRVLDKNTDYIGGTTRQFTGGDHWKPYPEDGAAPFTPDIVDADKILYQAMEPNATTRRKKAMALVTNMAQALRPMYRGHLKILGRAIWPHDIVLVNDEYSMMHGQIEVDAVVHEFTADTGWITTIEPHAVVTANSPWALYKSSFWANVADVVDLTFDIITWGSIIAMACTGIGAVYSAAAIGAMRAMSAHAAKKGFAGLIRAGVSRAARRQLMLQVRKTITKKEFGRAAGIATRRLARKATENFLSITLKPAAYYAFTLPALRALSHSAGYGVSAFLDFDAYHIGPDGGYLPVSVKPLYYKGWPLVAGIVAREEYFMSFGDKTSATLADLSESLQAFFGEAIADEEDIGRDE